MAQTAPAKKYFRALCLGVWLSQPFWLAASVACAQGSSLCGEEDELLTPSAWCTIERSTYLLTDTAELITPDAWRAPLSELVTPDDWRVR